MTEKRIKEMAEMWWNDDRMTILDFIPIVAAEARGQGIDEMREALPKDLYWYEGGEIVMPVDKAERLKEQRT